ncbi:hypothetical protein DFH09DRAFT_1324656 [Mycena vulgaris]|nr:hypothetical protein DFH09DRAFT_1324656 [Mycena vulgaris]
MAETPLRFFIFLLNTMGFKLTASFALLSLILGQAIAADVFYNIPIENVRVAPDGFARDAIQAGIFPGQLIIANKGDVLHLNVTNKLPSAPSGG